jgi:hypothetical protein
MCFMVNWCSFHNKNITYLFPPRGRAAFILKLFERLIALVYHFMMLVISLIYLTWGLWLKPNPLLSIPAECKVIYSKILSKRVSRNRL